MPPLKWLSFAAGLGLLALIWLGPLVDAWRDSFTAHMVAHMGVIAIATPLIAMALPVRQWFQAELPLAFPLVLSVFEMAVVWAWHTPALRAAAQASLPLTVVEQAMFFLCGLLLWSTSLAPGSRAHAAVGSVALLATSIHMTLLGALLALSQRPLFGGGQVTCFGLVLDARQDQELGGVIMLLVGAVVYLAGGLCLVSRVLRTTSRTAT